MRGSFCRLYGPQTPYEKRREGNRSTQRTPKSDAATITYLIEATEKAGDYFQNQIILEEAVRSSDLLFESKTWHHNLFSSRLASCIHFPLFILNWLDYFLLTSSGTADIRDERKEIMLIEHTWANRTAHAKKFLLDYYFPKKDRIRSGPKFPRLREGNIRQA